MPFNHEWTRMNTNGNLGQSTHSKTQKARPELGAGFVLDRSSIEHEFARQHAPLPDIRRNAHFLHHRRLIELFEISSGEWE